jgi:hypothetical protein
MIETGGHRCLARSDLAVVQREERAADSAAGPFFNAGRTPEELQDIETQFAFGDFKLVKLFLSKY